MEKCDEDSLREFLAYLEKNRQENITSVEEIKSTPPCIKQVESPHNSGQDKEALQIDTILEESKDDLETIVASVEKAESNLTCAESIESKEASFIDEEHGKLSETAVLDFSGCKGVDILPYEFRAKEIDEHQVQKDIAEHSSVDIEHQSNEAEDPENKEEEIGRASCRERV